MERDSLMCAACAATSGRGEVPAHAAAEGHVWLLGSTAARVCVNVCGHVTTEGHKDVPALGCRLMPQGCVDLAWPAAF